MLDHDRLQNNSNNDFDATELSGLKSVLIDRINHDRLCHLTITFHVSDVECYHRCPVLHDATHPWMGHGCRHYNHVLLDSACAST